MIGIDTNVLLRLWLNDDPEQAEAITKLLTPYQSQIHGILINDLVLVEAVWVLRSVYGQSKAAIVDVLRRTLAEPAYRFDDRTIAESAVAAFEDCNADFSDCLIAAKNAASDCDFTATFDRAMGPLPGIKVL